MRPPAPPAGSGADPVEVLRARPPARVLVGRAGPAYRTDTQLGLREDQAAAADAVHAELDLARAGTGLFEVRTRAADKTEYLLRPDGGRRLSDAARADVLRLGRAGADLQVVI